MNELNEVLCVKCNNPMDLANSIDCDNHYKYIYVCKNCSSDNNLINKVAVEAKDDNLTLAEIDHITKEVEHIGNNIDSILKRDAVPKRTFRELNCFNSREFEKGIEEVGMFYIIDSPYTIEFGLGVEAQFHKQFNKNQEEITKYLEEQNVNNKLKECVNQDLLKYAGLNNLILVRFGLRKDNNNLVIDINKPMVNKSNPSKTANKVHEVVAPLMDILFT